MLTFRDEAEAVAIANGSDYGLTAGVFTNGSSRHYGGLPFGGVKASGVGREESVDELLSYTQTKAVMKILM